MRDNKLKMILVCVLAVLGGHYCMAQLPVNNPVDPTDTELTNAVAFVSRYFGEFERGGRVPDYTRYWTAEDCREYKRPDQLVYGINTEAATYIIGKPNILYAKPESGYVHVKTLFGTGDATGKVSVMSITNHYVQHGEHGRLYFVNPIRLAGKGWQVQTVGSITYYFPPYHQFDKTKAAVLTERIAKLQKDWGLLPINIRYYFADTKEELEHLRGFDFTVAMGNRDKPSGMSDDVDNLIYCGGWGENYFHEVVHVYLNKVYPYSPLKEGLAVFYGGSMGHELAWHIRRLNQYLALHADISLDKLDSFYYMDNNTNPYSTIAGMLCADAFSRHGMDGLKRIMSYTSLDEIMTKELGAGKGEWNKALREMIGKYSRP